MAGTDAQYLAIREAQTDNPMPTDRCSCRGSNWYEDDSTTLGAVDQVTDHDACDRPVTVRRGDRRIRRGAHTKGCTTWWTSSCIRRCAACRPRWRRPLQVAAKLAWVAALATAACCAWTTIGRARGHGTLASTAVLAAVAFGAAVGAIERVVRDVHAMTGTALSALVTRRVANGTARSPGAGSVSPSESAEIARSSGGTRGAGCASAPTAGRFRRSRTTDGEQEPNSEPGSLCHRRWLPSWLHCHPGWLVRAAHDVGDFLNGSSELALAAENVR